jgi:N-formylglutamate deformylase
MATAFGSTAGVAVLTLKSRAEIHKISSDIGAALPPSRNAPPPAIVPVSTGGLYPRDYRRCLTEERRFLEVSEFDSTTVAYDGISPIIGTALHYNDAIRNDLIPKLGIEKKFRYYEEDPETHRFLGPMLHTLTPNQSRFEMDLNRPADTTVYTKPSLAWGLDVWNEPLNQYEREFSLEKWYEFQTMIDCAVEDSIRRFGYAIVFDFHSYNYQRKGPTDWRTDTKPVINLGTRHLKLNDRGREIKDWFFNSMKQHTIEGEECLIEENGVFYGGYLNRRLSHMYGDRVIPLSVEYKKVYMNELTGEVYDSVLEDMVSQMDDSIRGLAGMLGVPIREGRSYKFCGED